MPAPANPQEVPRSSLLNTPPRKKPAYTPDAPELAAIVHGSAESGPMRSHCWAGAGGWAWASAARGDSRQIKVSARANHRIVTTPSVIILS
jgi:hypothetical protein